MDWCDEGIVLTARKHGEGSAIVTLLTRNHGRHAGLVRGGAGRRQRGVFEAGNRVEAAWRARLAEHLGTYSCELIESVAACFLDDKWRLAALSAACAMTDAVLPERDPHARVFEGSLGLLAALKGQDGAGGGGNGGQGRSWPALYVRWELMLLGELGFGLDLGSCAATGENDGLAYVSPKSGRAVSLSAGAPYRDRLLALPRFLTGDGGAVAEDVDAGEIRQGLKLTGYFFQRHVFAPGSRPMPPSRTRFVEGFR
jgi:DNA repair protein RecO (recombination protein O)